MATADHRIRRLRVQVSLGSQPDAFAARRRLRAAWEPLVAEALDAAMQASDPGGLTHLSRLELRVSLSELDAMDSELPERVREAALAELAIQLRPSVSVQPELSSVQPELTVTHSGEAHAPQALSTEATSPARAVDELDALRVYLRGGTLPWPWGDDLTLAEAELRRAAEHHGGVLLTELGASVEAVFRLLELLEPARRGALVRGHADGTSGAGLTAMTLSSSTSRRTTAPISPSEEGAPLSFERARRAAIEALLEPPPSPDLTLPRLRALALLLSLDGPPAPGSPPAEALLRLSGALPASTLSPVLRALGLLGPTPLQQKSLRPRPHPRSPAPAEGLAASAIEPAASSAGEPPASSAGEPAAPSAARLAEQRRDLTAAILQQAAAPPSDWARAPGFPLPVPHAGLVLLQGFLSPYLRNCGCQLPSEGPLPEETLPRAAALMHHLVSGEDHPREFELPLVKVLLGLRPDAPLLVCEGLLHDEDRAQAQALLAAAVSHWSVLKGTSIEGLRQSFLLRRGLLRDEDSGWRLKVEPGPYDMLLARLPWGFGVTKLPWMPRPLFTEWSAP